MPNVKLKPEQPRLHFLGIDVTKTIDTVVWGHLWNAIFGWRNLLWELDKDSTDSQRRIDKAHTKLPIARVKRRHRGNNYADTTIMPQGIDAKGTDKLWTGTDASSNLTHIDAACLLMQTLIISPGADKTTSSLNDTGQGVTADVVYISSHGGSDGTMSGDIAFAEWIFDPAKSANAGAQFSGPGWLLLSNCNTLKADTHSDWLKLMTGLTPLRGIVGFQDLCPLAPGSADVFASFIRRLAKGKTFIKAWEKALKVRGLEERWVVLCHKNAVDDTIVKWNSNRLTTIPPNSKILKFNKSNPTGIEVTPAADPFESFWSKGSTRITATNRSDSTNKLKVGDAISITVKPSPPATTFATGTKIAITVVYIRTNYPKAKIDVIKMFNVTDQSGASAPTTADLNPDSPGGHDSWELLVIGTPSEVKLNLNCKDLSMLPFSNYPLWLRVDISTVIHDFIRNGSIVVNK